MNTSSVIFHVFFESSVTLPLGNGKSDIFCIFAQSSLKFGCTMVNISVLKTGCTTFALDKVKFIQ